jgi:hypothetical protein
MSLILINVISGCGRRDSSKPVDRIQSETTTVKESVQTTTEPVKEAPIVEPKFFSPYTGEEVNEAASKNIPFMAIIENSKEARPQSGLIDADIVFETSAEGSIPRMIALFQKNSPEKIGPVRSARPYFLDISREYNLPFAHCGTSSEAEDIIRKNDLMTLNEFAFSSSYWRDKARKAPHNLYTSSKNIRDLIQGKDYKDPSIANLKFDKAYWENNDLKEVKDFSLKVAKKYTADYSFKDNKYYKAMNSEPAINKEDTRQLAVSNVVIQVTTIKLQKDGIHLDIPLTGKGYGYVISNGKLTRMAWVKENVNSRTILKDEAGNEIPLSPGNTWWHIVDKNSELRIKN